MPKPGKQMGTKGKRAGKAPIEERNSAAKTVKESLFHFWCFFLLMWKFVWKLGRELFNFCPSDKMEESSVSLEKPDVASSSSSVATPSGSSVVAKCASEKQTDGPAEKMLSLGAANDKDHPCHARNSTGNSNEAFPVGPEDIEAEFVSTRHMDGGVDRVGYNKKGEAEVIKFGRLLHETDEIKSDECPGSEFGNKLMMMVYVRQLFSLFVKTEEFQVMEDGIKGEVLKQLKGDTEVNKIFKRILRNNRYTKILLTMFFQRGNMALKSSFERIGWRKDYHFPKFSNQSPEYKWWAENYVPKILKERLEILREAAKKWDPERDLFMVIEIIADTNSTLHPNISGMGMDVIFKLAKLIPSRDRKI